MTDQTLQGVLNLDKPAGLSSARAVDRVKRLLPRGTKIGHAGTLDPFATGVLLLLIGKATKLCERLMDEPKQYVATVKLGATTPTDDPESEETITPGAVPALEVAVREALMSQVGEILQRPSTFSAMKVAGRRAYDLAREGKPVVLEPRRGPGLRNRIVKLRVAERGNSRGLRAGNVHSRHRPRCGRSPRRRRAPHAASPDARWAVWGSNIVTLDSLNEVGVRQDNLAQYPITGEHT